MRAARARRAPEVNVFPLKSPPVNDPFFSDRYQPARERAWHLSIWTSPGQAAWCVNDVTDGSVVALATATGDRLPHEERLPLHPASASFIAVPEVSTLVPEGVLESGREAAHLTLVHGPLPAGTLRDEPIDALGARCIYLHDADAERRLLERFPQARPVALQALLVKTAMARATDRPAVLVHRTSTTCDLVIAHPDRVLLSNSYLAPTATDVLYFTLFALDRAGVRPETVRPVLCGASFTAEELTLMNTYLPTPVEHHDRPLPAEERWLAVLQQWSCA